MPSYIQIQGDPTKWWVDPGQSVNVDQPASQTLSVQITAPLKGTLLISPKAASIAVFENPPGADAPNPLPSLGAAIYVPTPTGPSGNSPGYYLPPSVNLSDLSSQIATIMGEGQSQTVALGGISSGGTLVLNGATLSFVVLCGATGSGGGAVPSG
jgi:hypothetical protein